MTADGQHLQVRLEVEPIHHEDFMTTINPQLIRDDQFDSVEYDLSYRSEKGNLSKYIKVRYAAGQQKDIQVDSITVAQPRLWAVKQEVLKQMDIYNVNFMLGTIPAIFFILTIGTSIAPASPLPGLVRPRYNVMMRRIPKSVIVGAGDEAVNLISRLRSAGKRVVVNIGGTGEVPDAINLNPNQVAPRKGIPDLIAKSAEEIDQVFAPNTVDEIVSNRLPPNTLDWTRVLSGSHKVLKQGGSISIRFQGVGNDAATIMREMRRLGFRNIDNIANSGAAFEAVK